MSYFVDEVTRGADGVAVRAQLSRVGVVAVAARDALRVHLALQERAPVVHLATLLSVGVVQRLVQERGTIVIEQWFSGFVAFRYLPAPRMTLRAYVDFSFGRARTGSIGIAARDVDGPRDTASFVETDGQALVVVSGGPAKAGHYVLSLVHSKWREPGP